MAANAGELINWNLVNITGPTENNTDFDGVPANNTSVASNITITDLVTASSEGHNGLVWSGGNTGPGKLNLQRWDHPADNPASFGNGNGNPNNWLQFGIQAQPGHALSLTSIEIAAWRNGAGAPATWLAHTSDDGGQTWQPFGEPHIQNTSGDFVFHPVTFSDLAEGTSLLVRFAATGPTGGSGNLHLNKFVINGTLASAAPPPVVSIQPSSPIVQPGQTITLTAEPAEAAIRFTLDGSTPGSESPLYSGPFTISNTTTVRAVAFDSAGQPGPIASRTFTVSSSIGTPNLLVIVGDSVGFGDLHCNGGVNIATPAIDSLAYDGIRFTQFTTTGGGGAAAQYALLTGRSAARSGMAGQPAPAGGIGWNTEEWTLGKMLRRVGYHTAFIGEWLLGDAAGSHPNDQGFQLFHGLPNAAAQNPPLAENRDVLTANPDPAGLLDALTQRTVDHIAALAPSAEPFAIVFHPPALPAAGSSLAGPHGNRIEALDQSVAQLLAALDSHNLADDTLVVFLGNGGAPRTTDGGSNGIFRDGAGTTWEGGLRSPMLARFPGTLPSGQMNLSLIWLPDLMPTIGAITGGQLAGDRPLDGMPRAAALTGTQTRPAGDETVFGIRHHNGSWQIATVRQGKWKSHLSIINIDPENNRPTTGNQLYDLHIDAEERINRATEQPATLNDLAAIAAAAANSLPPSGQTDLPAPKEPLEGEVSTLIESNGTTTVRYSFIRPADSIDDSYQIEHSTDLAHWQSMAIGPFVEVVLPLGGQREQLELAVPLGTPPLDGSRRFIRLTADRPSHD
jgi:arylsulfatase